MAKKKKAGYVLDISNVLHWSSMSGYETADLNVACVSVVGWIMCCPKHSNSNPRICEYIILYGIEHFAEVIMLKILREKDVLGLSGGPNVINHKGPYKNREARRPKARGGDETKVGVTCFEDGVRSYKPRNAASWSWKRQGNRFSPWNFQKE